DDALDPGFPEHTRHADVVHTIVGEEPFILGGKNRVANERRDVLIPGDVPIFPGEPDERLAVDVVDVTDRWKLESCERPRVRQVFAIDIDVVPGVESKEHRTQEHDT